MIDPVDLDAMDAYYTEMYKNHLLPPLGHMMKNPNMTVTERCRAIKYLADGSLALTASGAGWSAALGDKLLSTGEENDKIMLQLLHGRISERAKAAEQDVVDEAPAPLSQRPKSATVGSLKFRRSAATAKFTRKFQRSRFNSHRVHSLLRRRNMLRSQSAFKRVRRVSASKRQQHRIGQCLEDDIIKSRVEALQSLVPGGKQMNSSVLLNEAADYMMFLKFQVGVLQSLAATIEDTQVAKGVSCYHV